MPIFVPSVLGPNAPGLPGWIVAFVATPAASGCLQGWLSEEREPHRRQSGGIVRREKGKKNGVKLIGIDKHKLNTPLPPPLRTSNQIRHFVLPVLNPTIAAVENPPFGESYLHSLTNGG
jgi:hypothetical protein